MIRRIGLCLLITLIALYEPLGRIQPAHAQPPPVQLTWPEIAAEARTAGPSPRFARRGVNSPISSFSLPGSGAQPDQPSDQLLEPDYGRLIPDRIASTKRNNPSADNPVVGAVQPQGVDPANGSTTSVRVANQYQSASLISGYNAVADYIGAANAFYVIPPDTIGAVGPSQFVTMTNLELNIRDKISGALSPLSGNPIYVDGFFDPIHQDGDFGYGDIRVRFDRFTGRWILLEMGEPDLTEAVIERSNYLYMAISDGPVLSNATVFTYYYLLAGNVAPVDPNEQTAFFDFPTLSIDEDALYITANVFGQQSPYEYLGTSGFVISKARLETASADLVASGAVTALRGMVNPFNLAGAYSATTVDNFDTATNAGYFIGVDYSTSFGLSFSRLAAYRVNNPGGSPTFDGPIYIDVPLTDGPAIDPIAPSGAAIDSSDGRLIAAHIRDGVLYTSHAVGTNQAGGAVIDSGGVPDRIGVAWYAINTAGSALGLKDRGLIYDNAPISPKSYMYPAGMTNGLGDFAIGFSTVSNTTAIAAAVIAREATDPPGQMQGTPLTYRVGEDPAYNLRFRGTRTRWGDYSLTSLDPCDDLTLFTVQEYAGSPSLRFTRGTPDPSDDQYGNWALSTARLLVDPPTVNTPDPVLIGQASVVVNLTGTRFYNPPDTLPNFAGCSGGGSDLRVALENIQLAGSALTPGDAPILLQVRYVSPTQIQIVLDTRPVKVGTTATVRVINPDGQSGAGAGDLIFVTTDPPVQVGAPGGGSFPSLLSNGSNPTPARLPATGFPPVSNPTVQDSPLIVLILMMIASRFVYGVTSNLRQPHDR